MTGITLINSSHFVSYLRLLLLLKQVRIFLLDNFLQIVINFQRLIHLNLQVVPIINVLFYETVTHTFCMRESVWVYYLYHVSIEKFFYLL